MCDEVDSLPREISSSVCLPEANDCCYVWFSSALQLDGSSEAELRSP